MTRPILLLLSALGSTLSAAVYSQIDMSRPLSCQFSSTHHNRILYNDGRITKVINPEPRLQIRLEEQSGQVYVYATDDSLPPTTLSIITEEGWVQDLEISFEEKSSETVILQEPTPCCSDFCNWDPEDIKLSQIQHAVDSILSGHTPSGFFQTDIRCPPRRLKRGLHVQTFAKLENATSSIFVMQITNTTRRCRSLCEADLFQPGCDWIFLNQSCLCGRTSTLALIAFPRS